MTTRAELPGPVPSLVGELSYHQAEAFLRDAVDIVPASPPTASLADTIDDYVRTGLPPGTLVAIGLSNGRHLLTHYFALLLCGLVPLPVSPATPASRLLELARHLNIRAFVAAKPDAARYGATAEFRIGAQRLVRLPDAEGEAEHYEPGDVVMLTSGTSGMFSACVNRVGAVLRNAQRHSQAVGLRPGDTVLVTLPLYYSYAVVAQALAAYVSGARLIIGGPPFIPAGYRQVIEAHDVSVSSITPTIARRLLDAGVPLPRQLRALTVGGDQLNADSVGGLLALHSSRELYVTYGLTEAGPRVSTLSAHLEPRSRWASVGLPLPGVKAYLEDRQADGSGELIIESDTVLRRKVGQSVRQPLVAPGVIRTGDLFAMDDAGYLFFRGRLSQFAVVRGEKVSLHSLKLAAESVPGVVRAEPVVVSGDDGDELELVVHVVDPLVTDKEFVAKVTDALLLRSERPRRISVLAADPSAFHK